MTSSRTIPFICLFLSGWTSLTYELLWIKQLTLLFGGTLYAISAVLCAFMTGLALGAWYLSRYLNRSSGSPNRVRLYGILEGLIGIYGLIFPVLLTAMEWLYPLVISTSPANEGWLHGAEFLMSALFMLPSTFLMGATLPIIGAWAVGDHGGKIFKKISLLYSLNTFGAVFGCVITQFFTTRWLGVQGTLWSAVGLNILIFLLCFFWRDAPQANSKIKDEQSKTPFTPENTPDRGLSWLLLILFGYSGGVALSSEILWTRILVFPLGSSLYSFALILATFLFGIALGSLISEKLLGSSRWIIKFIMVELAIGVFCLLILPGFDQLTDWTLKADHLFYDLENTASRTLMVRSLFAFGLMFLPTLGFGLVFPLANQINFTLFGTVIRTLGNSYAVNTAGAIVGTALTPFVLIPLFGIKVSLFILYAILITLSMAALIWHLQGRLRGWATSFAGLSAALVAWYFLAAPQTSAQQLGHHNFARIEINVAADDLQLLEYKEGNFSTLSVVEDRKTAARTLYVDGFSTATASDAIGGSAYMQAMGWVPMMLHPDPKRALVIGFGTGSTLGAVSRFPGVTVDGVEIDRNVLTLAPWFSLWNHDVLNRPHVNMIVQDGRQYLRWTEKRYDVITLEPMSPVQAGVNNLYSREFYDLARRRLQPGGIMMQWLPLHLVSAADSRAMIKTFQSAFLHTSVWNSFLTRIILLVGSDRPVSLDKKLFDRRLQLPSSRKMSEQIGVYDFLDFMDFYLTDGTALASLLKDAPIITDDRALLEHSGVNLVPPLKQQTDEAFLNLLKYRQFPPVTGLSPQQTQAYRQRHNLRTAQRLSIFSQRYKGPGYQEFSRKDYQAGMAKVREFFDENQNSLVSLSASGWASSKMPQN